MRKWGPPCEIKKGENSCQIEFEDKYICDIEKFYSKRPPKKKFYYIEAYKKKGAYFEKVKYQICDTNNISEDCLDEVHLWIID